MDQSYVREQIVDDEPSAPTPKVSRPLAFVAAGVLTLLLGMGIGDATSDPTASREYLALESELSDSHIQHAALTEDAELLSQQRDELTARVAALEEDLAALAEATDELEAGLAARESTVADQEVLLAAQAVEIESAQVALEARESAVAEAEAAAAAARGSLLSD